ncbi:MAG: hypothetical protein AUJ06_00835 [Chloroflexi bacterium 13_1_40CM_3_70_6]|nr:MAG: hypothetical protein AUJ06_00835 [Chloroflexi bacterium 13_1_40CM_3_70_6]
MRVASLDLEDFRGYARARFELSSGVTAFVGPNGAGKTNLLEAVHLVARGESTRANDDGEMIRWGAPLARVIVEAASGEETRRLEVTLFAPVADIRRRPRRYAADGAPRRADDILGAFTVVAFFPQDTDLLASAPSARRRYLDAMLAQDDREHRCCVSGATRKKWSRRASSRSGTPS